MVLKQTRISDLHQKLTVQSTPASNRELAKVARDFCFTYFAYLESSSGSEESYVGILVHADMNMSREGLVMQHSKLWQLVYEFSLLVTHILQHLMTMNTRQKPWLQCATLESNSLPQNHVNTGQGFPKELLSPVLQLQEFLQIQPCLVK